MFDVLSILASVLAPVFLCAAIGFGWCKLGHDFDTAFVSRLILTIGTPCLVFSALTSHDLSLNDFGMIAFAATVALAIFGVGGAALLWLTGLPVRPFVPSIMMPNVANMGLPIALFAFGDSGLALAVVFSAVGTLAHFTVGVGLASGSFSLRTVATSPAIIAIALAVGFIATEATPPDWIANTTGLLAGMAIPILLISLGVSLARLKLRNVKRALIISTIRIGLGVATGFGLAYAMRLGPIESGVVIIQCAMPSAVLNYLMAARYNGPAEDVAGVVVVSTIMVFVLLPLLLLIVL